MGNESPYEDNQKRQVQQDHGPLPVDFTSYQAYKRDERESNPQTYKPPGPIDSLISTLLAVEFFHHCSNPHTHYEECVQGYQYTDYVVCLYVHWPKWIL